LRIFALVFHFVCGTALRILLGAEYEYSRLDPFLGCRYRVYDRRDGLALWAVPASYRGGEESEKVKGEGESKKPHE
jgi:hypothetical protein